MIRSSSLPLLLGWLLTLSTVTMAADPHVLFESRCGACHGHSGAFAHETLILSDGDVRSALTGRDMAAFLPTHRGALTADEAELLLDMFRRQITWGGVFQARCRVCHDSARALARHDLVIREGRLLGRYTGRDIADFLAGHGRADSAEQVILIEMLRWQLEVLERVDALR